MRWVLVGVRVFLLAALAVSFGSCSDPRARLPVAGSITLNGKPLETGDIVFVPADSDNAQSGGKISNGEYSLPAKRGLSPGTYKVIIYSVVGRTYDKNGFMVEPGKSVVGPKYNEKSQLTVEIKKGLKNVFDFSLD